MKRKTLGELLVQGNLVTPEQLKSALSEAAKRKKRLGETLVIMDLVKEEEVCRTLSIQLNIPRANLAKRTVKPKILGLLSPVFCYQKRVVPLGFKDRILWVAMENPTDYDALKDVSFATGFRAKPMIEQGSLIVDFLLRHYPPPLESQDAFHLGARTGADMIQVVEQINDQDDISFTKLEQAARGGVIRELTNGIIANAITLNASDIHIEPQEDEVVVRFRVDGIIRDVMTFTKTAHPTAVSRIKIMASLDITERRVPQDGRARIRVMERVYDLRVSSLPTYYGEKIAIRLLEARLTLPLEHLGIPEAEVTRFKSILKRPQGIVLITGPTGSGKTTTLYSALGYLFSPRINIVTIEDPVEYSLPGINQVQVNTAAGMTFAKGLRSLLRQDPDVVMVGEIRDAETAEIAFQAAQTGHLVLSTLHTNDAPSAVFRLKNMGLDPFWISSALICVIGQRLVRRVHPDCAESDEVSPEVLERFPPAPGAEFKRGRGCAGCQSCGYLGRVGVYEIFVPDQGMDKLIVNDTGAAALERYAVERGMVPMAIAGFKKALEGVTTVEEVLRVVPPPEVGKAGAAESAGADRERDFGPARAVVRGRPGPAPALNDTIMVIDDDPAILRYMGKILTNEFYAVVQADNGKEGLEAVFSDPPDLILVDYNMPGMDGMAFIEKLRAHSRMSAIPVVMLTASQSEETEVQALTMGADDWISKPINRDRLLARIKRLLKR